LAGFHQTPALGSAAENKQLNMVWLQPRCPKRTGRGDDHIIAWLGRMEKKGKYSS